MILLNILRLKIAKLIQRKTTLTAGNEHHNYAENILKQEHAVVQNASEVLEGISYQIGKLLL